jgi:hypothetical protein
MCLVAPAAQGLTERDEERARPQPDDELAVVHQPAGGSGDVMLARSPLGGAQFVLGHGARHLIGGEDGRVNAPRVSQFSGAVAGRGPWGHAGDAWFVDLAV